MDAPAGVSKSYIIIPARLASTRLPRKLLLRETGKPLIQHTYEAACRAKRPAGVCVATDHKEIFDEVLRFGGRAEMTDPQAPSGTDRVAEVARRMPDVDIIVNVQGRRAGNGGRVDRPGDPAAGGTSGGRHVHAGHADPPPGATRRSGLREGRVRPIGPGNVFQPQPDSPCAAVGRPAADGRSARVLPARRPLRLPPRLPAAAWHKCRSRRWRRSRNSNNSACSRPATRSSSASSTSRPSASTRRKTIGRLWPNVSSELRPVRRCWGDSCTVAPGVEVQLPPQLLVAARCHPSRRRRFLLK